MRALPPVLLVAAALLAGCGGSAGTPEATRPGGLTIGVGGSAGTAGVLSSQPRTDATRPR